MSIKLVTVGQYDTNIGARTYVMDTPDTYKQYKLKNREFAFDVDVSTQPCGINGALYFVDMDADGGKSRFPTNAAGARYGTVSVDASHPCAPKTAPQDNSAQALTLPPPKPSPSRATATHSARTMTNLLTERQTSWDGRPTRAATQTLATASSARVRFQRPTPPAKGETPRANPKPPKPYQTGCTEMDIWEANSISTAVTPHMCTVSGQYRCNGTECGDGTQRFLGVCDKNGCDMNPFRLGNPGFFGPGQAPPPPAPGQCTLSPDTNNMGTIMGTPTIQTDPVGCCATCNATAGCVGFTFVASSSMCFLKSALGTPVADPGATSGSIIKARAGAGFTVDTTKPFTVVTQFVTADGTDAGALVEIRRSFVQNGVHIPSPPAQNIPGSNASSVTDSFCKAKGVAYTDNDNFETFGGLARMGQVMDGGMTLVISSWVDYEAHMLWLDSNYPTDAPVSQPGVPRGTCDTSSGVPEDVIKNHPDATTTFSKISIGPIGFTEAALKRRKAL
jgi:hypothetical protein